MTREIARQGFVRQDWTYQKRDDDEALALRIKNTHVCELTALIYWRTDAAGNLSSIRGDYRAGCL